MLVTLPLRRSLSAWCGGRLLFLSLSPADAQYHLGLLHYYGQGFAPDVSSAARLFREAATRGHPQAAVNLAAILEWGAGEGGGVAVPKDAAGAFAWYSAAAEAGDSRGAHSAGVMLYEGRVPGYDERERFADAFALFEQAVEGGGHAPSLYYLGVLYEYGAHRPQDFVKAAELYRRGCDGGDGDGDGGGGGGGRGKREWEREQDGGPATRAPPPSGTTSSLQHGDPDCCFHLGLLHAYGRGFEQNHPAALAIFGACERLYGHPGCLLYLGLMYASGQGTPVDYEAARVYLQRAGESGDVRFVPQAHEAFSKLDELMREAEGGITATLEGIAKGLAARPKGGEEGRMVVVEEEVVAAARRGGEDWRAGRGGEGGEGEDEL